MKAVRTAINVINVTNVKSVAVKISVEPVNNALSVLNVRNVILVIVDPVIVRNVINVRK